jgi:hypothetical protein
MAATSSLASIAAVRAVGSKADPLPLVRHLALVVWLLRP